MIIIEIISILVALVLVYYNRHHIINEVFGMPEEIDDIREVVKFLPLEVEITQEIIDNADLLDGEKCIGALALQKALPKRKDGKPWMWGYTYGWQGQELPFAGRSIEITTKEGLDLTSITKPTTVTFIIKK